MSESCREIVTEGGSLAAAIPALSLYLPTYLPAVFIYLSVYISIYLTGATGARLVTTASNRYVYVLQYHL